MQGKIEDCVVVDHEDDRMPRRRGAALHDMRVHDGRAGDRSTIEEPVSGFGLSERAELSRQALVRGSGDRRHGAHETVGASGIAKVSRPELGLGPTTRFIEHVRSLARPPGAAKSARDMRSLAHKRKMWVTVSHSSIATTAKHYAHVQLDEMIELQNKANEATARRRQELEKLNKRGS